MKSAKSSAAPARLAKLKELAEKATPGPWSNELDTLAGNVWVYAKNVPLLEPEHWLKKMFRVRSDSSDFQWIAGETRDAKRERFWQQKQADAEFIAAANPKAVLEILAAHQALYEALSALLLECATTSLQGEVGFLIQKDNPAVVAARAALALADAAKEQK